MTEPVGNRAGGRTRDIEAELRDIAGAEEGVTARTRPEPHQMDAFGVAVVQHALVHNTVLATEHVLASAGTAAGALGVEVAGHVLTPLFLLKHVVDDGDERAIATRRTMQHDRMRGALAVLEGRVSSPEVRAEMAQNPSYADGVHRAEALASSMSPEDLQAVVGFVRRSGNEGQAAVCLGRDSGAAFERRYENDPAFAHGVDFARRLQTSDPAGFAERMTRFAELDHQQRAARERTPIRP